MQADFPKSNLALAQGLRSLDAPGLSSKLVSCSTTLSPTHRQVPFQRPLICLTAGNSDQEQRTCIVPGATSYPNSIHLRTAVLSA